MIRARVLARRGAAAGVGAVIVGLMMPLAPAVAAPATPYEMPFPCGQEWYGSTRAYHSPSPRSVDWNRADDDGDPVVASAAGVVIVSDSVPDTGYGKWVMIDHGNGETSLYAHLSDVTVGKGAVVDSGTQIGNLGSTGNSTGPHLHFEERTGSTVMTPYLHGAEYKYGWATSQNCKQRPMAANMEGDATDEVVLFRGNAKGKGVFVIQREGRKNARFQLGRALDDPILGDWDGNGYANVGVRNPETRTFKTRAGGVVTSLVWGRKTDRPVAGDWDGDGVTDLGIWRASAGVFVLRAADGTTRRVLLGDSNDLPVTGDWDADGKTDVGVFDQATATFTLRTTDTEGLVWTSQAVFGKAGDLPVPGDWDADGRTELGTWNPLTATIGQRFYTSAARVTPTTVPVGTPRAAMGVIDPALSEDLAAAAIAEDLEQTASGEGHDHHDHAAPTPPR